MSVNLKKGGSVNLRKDNPNLSKIYVGLGWDPVKSGLFSSHEFDIDASVIAMDKNDRKVDVLYFNRKEIWDGALIHHGDNLTGEGDGDDESATIDFSKVPENVKYIILAVTIDQAKARNQNFGLVDNSYVHVANAETGEDLVRYDLGEDFSTQKSVIFAELYRQDKEWKFRAVGEGYEKDLAELCVEYGLTVD